MCSGSPDGYAYKVRDVNRRHLRQSSVKLRVDLDTLAILNTFAAE